MIQTQENSWVHMEAHGGNDYTLCGLDITGDTDIGISPAEPTSQKVNCPDCIAIIHYCRAINMATVGKASSW